MDEESVGAGAASRNDSSGSDDAAKERKQSSDQPPSGASTRRRWIIGVSVAAVVIFAAAGFGWYYFTTLRFFESTDDAYLQSDSVTVSPKVGGYVAVLNVNDNQKVRAGQVLVQIDDRDYRVTVAQREAAVAESQADVANADAQIALQQAKIDEAEAQVSAAQAALKFAQDEQSRYQQLEATGNGTVQRAQQTSSNLQQRQAGLANAQATLTGAHRQLDVLRAQRQGAAAGLQASEAALAQAKLNLAYTQILAPIDGAVGDRAVQLGEYVQPGARLLSIVPLGRSIYLIANFKETQLAGMARGQEVDITVDTFGDHVFKGVVDSLAPGTGSQFALLPPENATGNFTKIVQRVPVKITLDPDDPALSRLRPGLSVEASVDLRTTPPGPRATLAEQRK